MHVVPCIDLRFNPTAIRPDSKWILKLQLTQYQTFVHVLRQQRVSLPFQCSGADQRVMDGKLEALRQSKCVFVDGQSQR